MSQDTPAASRLTSDAGRFSRIALVHSLAAQIRADLRMLQIPGPPLVFIVDGNTPGQVQFMRLRRAETLAQLTGSPELAASLAAAPPGEQWIIVAAFGGTSGGPASSFGVDVRLDVAPPATN
jgi:hypothetical protein